MLDVALCVEMISAIDCGPIYARPMGFISGPVGGNLLGSEKFTAALMNPIVLWCS